MISSTRVWPGFAKDTRDTKENRTQAAMSNHKFLTTNQQPDFKVTRADVEADAHVTSQMWLKHPAYKMTLASVQQGADADNDGLINAQEFRDLLDASGYTGAGAAALFSQIDADGDGQLTEAEIKMLSQGKATLTSGKR